MKATLETAFDEKFRPPPCIRYGGPTPNTEAPPGTALSTRSTEVHGQTTPMLLRHFIEGLIRLSQPRFPETTDLEVVFSELVVGWFVYGARGNRLLP